MGIRCVFWDSDNTLVDTAEHHLRKHSVVLGRHGIHLEENECRQRIYHLNGVKNWQWFVDELGLDVGMEEYLAEADEWFFSNIDNVSIRGGVVEAIGIAKVAGVRQAVVSNGRRCSVTPVLEAKGLVEYMDFVLCAEDCAEGKPSPEPYLCALNRMREIVAGTGREEIKPADCLVVEDDINGVIAAKAAGMRVIHRKRDKAQEPAAGADYVVFDEGEFLRVFEKILC